MEFRNTTIQSLAGNSLKGRDEVGNIIQCTSYSSDYLESSMLYYDSLLNDIDPVQLYPQLGLLCCGESEPYGAAI
ncbi:MAG: hypothetical protein EZS28_039600 [Streblomastix strix]|uniref:Uncharacterized protein n=1 Tax=Streblomastix strix TaxID=222440 RepID=A0A5J4U4L5_9EUKA|nr:MAG: hypothetical protein EZS28_039600 [Streblomastix strix]